jgi:hypothetical protein
MPSELFASLPQWVCWFVFSAWALMMAMFGIKLWYKHRYDKWVSEHPDWVEAQRKINQNNIDTLVRAMKDKTNDISKRGN